MQVFPVKVTISENKKWVKKKINYLYIHIYYILYTYGYYMIYGIRRFTLNNKKIVN